VSNVSEGYGRGIVMAAVVGAAVGAGVALLLAPCSGKEARGWLANRSREIKDKTTSAFEHAREATLLAAREMRRDPEKTGSVHPSVTQS